MLLNMKTSDFDYALPPELIAQTPIEPRDHSRLMILSRIDGTIEHRHLFNLLEYLCPGDVLVFNDSSVIPARLQGHKVDTGGKVEILLLRRLDSDVWEALVKPGRRVVEGTRIEIADGSRDARTGLSAEVLGRKEGGIRVVRFSDESLLQRLGQIPLPPYIHVPLAQPDRYQTVYARAMGSVAAPTAGLHFTPGLLSAIERKGVHLAFVTLHIGLDTFRPVRVDDPHQHPIHQEYGELSPEVAHQLNQAKAEGRRVICVGTTAVRVVEQASQAGDGVVEPFSGWTSLFILQGYRFRMVDAMVTNFHLPRSTLLMLVSAFGGKGFIDCGYQEAMRCHYRFYSFGDAMLII